MLYQRVITGLIGFFLVFFLIYFGGFYLFAGLLVAILFGLREFTRLIRSVVSDIDLWPLFAGGVLVTLGGVLSVSRGENYLAPLLLASFFLVMLVNIGRGPREYFTRVALINFGLLYIPFSMTHLLLLRGGVNFSGYDPFILVWLPLLVTWVTDIGAFFVGTKLGKKKLAPSISPKKSVEGALGGGVLGLLVALGLGWVFSWPFVPVLVLGLLLTVVGQAGDLAESCLKRNAGIKDSGNSLPGHGGFMDRMDSLIFTIPVAYYFVVYFF